jgi:nitrite reductase/ring-hydroxylating ferredoxin subunit
MPELFVAKTSELGEGDRQIVVTESGQEVGVFHQNGELHAYSNVCLHSGGPACEGLLINQVVDIIDADQLYHGQTFSNQLHFVCPWHGWEYDIKTGECIGDRRLKLRKYAVLERDEKIFIIT